MTHEHYKMDLQIGNRGMWIYRQQNGLYRLYCYRCDPPKPQNYYLTTTGTSYTDVNEAVKVGTDWVNNDIRPE